MKKAVLFLSVLFPVMALAGDNSSFIRSQVAGITKQRAWVLAAVRQGEFAGDPEGCRYFVQSVKDLKTNAIRTAEALGEDASELEAIQTLDARQVCR